MKSLLRFGAVTFFLHSVIAGWAGTPDEAKVIQQPVAKITDPWQVIVGGPGWLAGVNGRTGFHGVNPPVDVGVGEILKHLNAIAAFSGEVRKGRFGVFGDLLYLDAQASAGQSSGLVSKVDLGLQLFMGELFLSWRVIDGPHGWVDLLGGLRYTYLGEQVGLQANNVAIDSASTQLVNDFAQQLVTPNSNLRALINQNISDRLSAVDGRDPKLPVGPVAGDQKGKIRDAVQQVIQNRQPELAAAIRAGVTARVDQVKAQLSDEVAGRVSKGLNQSFSFYDGWVDPVVGVRGRLNLSKAFYLIGETDVGGFGIGSDIAWQGYAAVGCNLTRRIFTEVGYRALYDDFRDENFLYQIWLHGVQLSVGMKF